MPNNDSHQHVVKTSSQWNERAVEFWVVPRGCLCVELTPKGKTKIKIGEGNKYYSQLPYITDDTDLSDYYTKEEIENILDNLNRMAIMSTDEYDSKSDLPLEGNKLGDVRFVKSSSPSVTIDPDIYLWNGIKWIYVGNELPDIDLNKYLKKTEFHEMFDPVKERVDDIGPKVDEMYPIRHTHTNKSILDNTTASYTSEEKIKLAGLHNYDIEISDLQSKAHIHDNKTFLDTITQEYQIWSQEDRYKFDHIKNYDQDIAEIRVDIQTLESKAHTHANKNILDQTTASFTVEDKTKLDSLHNDEPFVGTTGLYPGVEGNVPAPKVTDVGKFLSSDGSWKLVGNEGVLDITQDDPDALNELTVHYHDSTKTITVPYEELEPATDTTLGGIIVGDNLTITPEGVLSATGGGGGSSETYTAGDAISIDDSTSPLTATLTHFKWEISQTRAKAAGTVYVTLQVGEIEFYDENDQLITFSAIAGSFKSDSPNPPSPSYATTPTVQTPDKIIDNDITTKCCVTNFTSELDAMVFIFELDSTNPITAQDIKRYRYYTADDDTSADPVTWTLSVSANGIEWFVVDTQTEFNVPTAREISTDYFTMTKPTIPAKSINVKYDDGLMLDANGNLVVQTGQGIEISNNAVTAKLGVGLTFDNIDAITLDETIDLALNCDYSQ